MGSQPKDDPPAVALEPLTEKGQTWEWLNPTREVATNLACALLPDEQPWVEKQQTTLLLKGNYRPQPATPVQVQGR